MKLETTYAPDIKIDQPNQISKMEINIPTMEFGKRKG